MQTSSLAFETSTPQMIFITVTCLVRAIVNPPTVRSYVTRRRSQAHHGCLPEGYRATSPRALAGGHRPKRSVASIAHFAQWADTRGPLIRVASFDARHLLPQVEKVIELPARDPSLTTH